MYIQGMAQQTQVFLLCIGFGFSMGLFYDVFSMLRKMFFTSRITVFIQDIVYFLVCTVGAFFFLLCINGLDLRFYVLAGMGMGFLVYYFTLGIIVSRFCKAVATRVNRLLQPIFSLFKRTFSFLAGKTRNIIDKKLKILNKKRLNT